MQEIPTLPLPPPEPESEARAVAKAEPPSHIAPLTLEDVERNHLSLAALPAHLQDIEKFIPELQDKTPGQKLKILSERYAADRSAANASVLQHAVNRITTRANAEPHLKREIEEAIEVLHEIGEYPGQGDDIWLWAYKDIDFGQPSMFADLQQGWVYWTIPYVGDAMNDAISSLSFACTTAEVGANICLFEHARFVGRYQNYALSFPRGRTGVVSEDVSYVGDDFNDITSSILVVRRFANETQPVSVGALVPQSAVLDIVNAQDKVRSAGNATFTWDLWPNGSDGHPNDPQKMFLYVVVPVMVETPAPWADYYAEIRYWIYIYVDGAGKLQGYVAWYGCYVESGWITGSVVTRVMNRIPGTIGQVNGLVSRALALANVGGPYRFMYYLPGRNAFTGDTSEDVSIVAVR